MSLEIVRAKQEHVPEIGRIIFAAFKGIQDRHAFPLDITTVDFARFMAGMMVGRPDFYGVTAILDGKLSGRISRRSAMPFRAWGRSRSIPVARPAASAAL